MPLAPMFNRVTQTKVQRAQLIDIEHKPHPGLSPMALLLRASNQRYWNIHFAKKTQELKQIVNYLGSYLKRPPISASRLLHYSGGTVVFKYLNHRDGKYKTKALTPEE